MVAGLVAGVVTVVLYLATVPLFFRGAEKPRLQRELIVAQLELLGPMRAREWASVFGVVVFIVLVISSPLHKISPPWVGLLLLYFLLVFNYLRGSEFKDKIDWPFLMYLAGLTGMVSAMNHLGLSAYLAGHLGWLGAPMKSNFYAFVAILTLVLFVLRLFAPINAVVSIAATILMPLAEINGVNPWVVGFIILTMGECWFMPYQCSYYLQFEELTRKNRVYDEKSFLMFNAFSNLLKLAGIYASIPFWQRLGLL
jgi:divalent anion:Na+ symporter, DASS family